MRRLNKKYLILGVLLIVITSMGCTESSVEKGSTSTAVGEVATEASATTAPPVKEEVPSQLDLKVGDSAVVNSYGDTQNTEISVKSVAVSPFYSYYSDILKENRVEFAPDNKDYYLFDVEVKNVGEKDYYFMNSFFILDDSGLKYDPEFFSGGDILLFDKLYPNTRLAGKLLFVLPDTVSKPKLGYDFASLFDSDTKLVFWTIDQETSELVEEISGEVSVSNVEWDWEDFGMGMTMGSIGTVSYAIKNTGNTPIVPIVNLEIKRGSTTIKQETDIMDNEQYSMYVVGAGTTEKYEEFLYESVDSAGNYDVILTVVDLRTGQVIGSVTKLVTLS